MLFVIYGSYKTIIRKNTKSLTKKVLENDVNELNCVKIDYEESSISDILKEMAFLPFGYDKKVIVIENCEALFKEKNYEEFVDAVNLNSEYIDVILNIFSAKVAQKHFEKITNKKIVEVKELTDSDWERFIQQFFAKRSVTIDNNAVLELKERTNNDIDLLQNEMEKLVNYSSHITLDDVKLLVTEPLNENSFELLDLLIQNKKELALKRYKDLLIKNNDPILLISLLSTQLKFLNIIYYLLKVRKLSNNEAADILKVKPGRIYFASKNIKYLNQEIIDKAFDDLYKLDNDIKHSAIDKVLGFELFILNFGGK